MNMDILGYFNRVKKYFLKGISLAYFRVCKEYRKNQKALLEIKNRHQGSRAFIICNGPSLRPEDLDKIQENGDISFACNKIDKIFGKCKWRPTYYAVLDETYQFSLLKTMNEMPAEIKFFRRESYWKTRNVLGDKLFLNTIGSKKLLKDCKFSDDCSKQLYTIATTTYSLFQLAVYMGVKELYIIGCDNSYAREIGKDGKIQNTGHASYFAGSDPKGETIAVSTWQMNVAYEYASKYAKEHGFNIYNATRGGYLEAFERVDFDKLF